MWVTRVMKLVFGGAVLGVTSALVSATEVAAQDADTGGIDDSQIVMATVFVVAAIVVIAIGLYFSYGYHQRLLKSIDEAIKLGTPVTTTSEESLEPRARGISNVGVSGPATVEVGKAVTYQAIDTTDPENVSWVIEGAGATPASGTGAKIDVTFSEPGKAKVTPKQEGLTSVALEVTVVEPTAGAREGIVLPFVIRNWARFVVVIFGVGTIAALMALDVLSAEGGIGVLGALLGIGGATAAGDSESKPTGTKPPPA